MTYSIDDSNEDRVRILFTSPYAWELDLRYMKIAESEYQMAVSSHFKPEGSAAMVSFVRNLTPAKLAEFFNDVAEYMLSKAAEINAAE
jgi:hypothetical protein